MSIEKHAQALKLGAVMVTAIVSAMSFIIALFWRDAISAFIEQFMPTEQSVWFKIITAVCVTIFGSLLIYFLYRSEKLREELERKTKTKIVYVVAKQKELIGKQSQKLKLKERREKFRKNRKN